MTQVKNVYVVAGPNGAGKTTFAREFLPNYAHCPNFVNADLIAQGLSPFQPQAAAIKAGKLVLRSIDEYAAAGVDFGFETTLSGRTHAKLFKKLSAKGYKVHLFFLWVPAPGLSLMRIKNRVSDGGHDVPGEDVLRRFSRSLNNFFGAYKDMVATWMLFDNSGMKPVLAARRTNGTELVENKAAYESIIKGI
ncbi:MAG: zeta toxin family protein [Elusimicrobia bacterium]|nr:zeta toxin family protein [Elusimicrobiota bacterium]